MNRVRKTQKSKCKQCGMYFSHRSDHKNKYCSRQCAGMARRHSVKCRFCGKRVNKSRNKFCSSMCAMKQRGIGAIVNLLCDECGVVFSKHQCHLSKNNFCSKECQGIWQSKYRVGKNHPRYEFIGTERKRIDENGRKRTWVKVAHPNIWAQKSRLVWEQQGHKIPNGKIIHHIDGNTLNDNIINLKCVTRKWHINCHRKDLDAGKAKL